MAPSLWRCEGRRLEGGGEGGSLWLAERRPQGHPRRPLAAVLADRGVRLRQVSGLLDTRGTHGHRQPRPAPVGKPLVGAAVERHPALRPVARPPGGSLGRLGVRPREHRLRLRCGEEAVRRRAGRREHAHLQDRRARLHRRAPATTSRTSSRTMPSWACPPRGTPSIRLRAALAYVWDLSKATRLTGRGRVPGQRPTRSPARTDPVNIDFVAAFQDHRVNAVVGLTTQVHGRLSLNVQLDRSATTPSPTSSRCRPT